MSTVGMLSCGCSYDEEDHLVLETCQACQTHASKVTEKEDKAKDKVFYDCKIQKNNITPD